MTASLHEEEKMKRFSLTVVLFALPFSVLLSACSSPVISGKPLVTPPPDPPRPFPVPAVNQNPLVLEQSGGSFTVTLDRWSISPAVGNGSVVPTERVLMINSTQLILEDEPVGFSEELRMALGMKATVVYSPMPAPHLVGSPWLTVDTLTVFKGSGESRRIYITQRFLPVQQ